MLGPVFHWELVRTSRRSSRWLLRTIYAAVLLSLLWINWSGHDLATVSDQTTTVQAIRNCLTDFHDAFSICQLVAALFLGPIFAAGSVIEERSGRTLSLILTSATAAVELVAGKLCAALVRLGDLYLCSLPLSAICVLLGAVQPETVVAELLLAISAAFAGSALALLIAAWCKRLADSLVLTFLVQGLWYSLPAFNVLALLFGRLPTVPGTLLRFSALRATNDLVSAPPDVWWGIWVMPTATMLGFGFALSLAATLSIRPASCWLEFDGVRRPRPAFWRLGLRAASVAAARPVWDQPVLWRELRCRRATVVEKMAWAVLVAAGLVVGGLIVREWPTSVQAMPAATFCHLAFIAFPLLAVAGATGFADERDGRMLELIRLTDLRHSELVNAKSVRLAVLVLILLMPPLIISGVRVAIGYSTWMSLILVTANCLASMSFAALLGLAIGVRSRKTIHAVATTIAFGLVGGFLIPVLSVASVRGGPTPTQFIFVTLSPPLQCFFLTFHDTVRVGTTPAPPISVGTMRAVALMWTLAYGFASLGLYLSSLRVAVRTDPRET